MHHHALSTSSQSHTVFFTCLNTFTNRPLTRRKPCLLCKAQEGREEELACQFTTVLHCHLSRPPKHWPPSSTNPSPMWPPHGGQTEREWGKTKKQGLFELCYLEIYSQSVHLCVCVCVGGFNTQPICYAGRLTMARGWGRGVKSYLRQCMGAHGRGH